MAVYEVRMTHSAEKELENLSKSLLSVLWQRIKALADQPRPRQAKKLKGAEKAYRLRVRDYRIIYTIDDEQKLVTVTAVRHRKDIYR
ncbi:type II toxin-antitoxin system RelE/ParE family toxin [Dehalococcoidia bacterium]|nr:type II toxin-antitoxin system RelE/ParE family toxin [Dehalococcoidia bacterium]